MGQPIILTTDLSQESQAAFDVAKVYAKALDSEIHILTVVEDPAQAAMIYAMEFPVFPEMEIQKQLMIKVRKDLESIVKEKFGDMRVRISVKEATKSIHEEITNYAQEVGAQLVVIATHGRSGFKNLIIGSVAERVARNAKCPVLVVPTVMQGS